MYDKLYPPHLVSVFVARRGGERGVGLAVLKITLVLDLSSRLNLFYMVFSSVSFLLFFLSFLFPFQTLLLSTS